MARWLLTILCLVLVAQAAHGVSDPRPDVLGVYFDAEGNQTCLDLIPVGTPFSVWLVYTNPTPAAILGFEAGYHYSGGFVYLGAIWPCDIVWIVEPDLDNLTVACAEPFPTSEATPLVRFDYMHLGMGLVDATFHVEKASGSVLPGTNPYIILDDGSLLEVLPGEPSFTTISCGVPVADVDWGTIKSLYR